MNLDRLIRWAINPALELLPPAMDSRNARVMLVAIALQESRATHRLQINGPARGYWQFEGGGGVAGVLRHKATEQHARAVCQELDVAPVTHHAYNAIAYHDVLAAAFARLLLWTLPGPLPTEHAEGWRQYLEAWRPGRPHERTWASCWDKAHVALRVIEPEEPTR